MLKSKKLYFYLLFFLASFFFFPFSFSTVVYGALKTCYCVRGTIYTHDSGSCSRACSRYGGERPLSSQMCCCNGHYVQCFGTLADYYGGCRAGSCGGSSGGGSTCSPVNGVCNSGWSATACNSATQVQTNYYLATGSCGGASTNCYQCRYKTCSEMNGDDCRYCLDQNDPHCPAPSPTPIPTPTPDPALPPDFPEQNPNDICTNKPIQADPNKCVLIRRSDGTFGLSCTATNAINPYVFVQGNNSGDGTENYRPIACSELGSQYTSADQCGNLQIPIPIENFCDGSAYFNGLASRCVVCQEIHAPWFQVVNGNIYAKGYIQNNNTNLNDIQVMRTDDLTCDPNNVDIARVGMPFAGNKVDPSITSQNTNPATASFTNGFASIDPEDYRFFSRALGYFPEELSTNIKACSDLNSNNIADFTFKDSLVCFIQSSSNSSRKLSEFLPGSTDEPFLIQPGVKKVIFVNGDIELDRAIISTAPQTNSQGFFLLIASGNITISPFLGDFVSVSNAGNCINQEPSLYGIFIADGKIDFIGGTNDATFRNYFVNRNCDKKLTVNGSFIGWGKTSAAAGKGISISRTFAGCTPGYFTDPTVPHYTSYVSDYNLNTPVVTFVYDPNLPHNLPNWVKKTVWSRFETN